MLKWIGGAALLCSAATAALAAPEPPRATVETGVLAGKRDGEAAAFLGVPYAAAPIGAGRWRAPARAARWAGVRDATRYGNSCMQSMGPPPPPPHAAAGTPPGAEPGFGPPGGGPMMAAQPVSEDCLFLNVWTPAARAKTKMPVLVFFHGGGWNGGSGSGGSIAGASMTRHGVVMVTVNFRLGLFGFLAHQWLLDEAGDTGNYGIMDQVAALQWVRRNIAAFGGDPARVTIAGQSSGAAAVRDLASIPASRGLFQRGIPESTPFWGGGPIPLAEALGRGAAYARLAGADSLQALRAMPADQLQKLVPGGLPRTNAIGFLPVSGDAFFPAGAKERDDIAMMAGSNTHEDGRDGREWLLDDDAGLQKVLTAHFKDHAATFAPFYRPANHGGSAQAAIRAIMAEGPAAEVALVRGTRAAGAAPVYTYLWTHARPGEYGAVHGSEMAYAYENFPAERNAFTTEDFAIGKTLNAYWVNFIKTGDPNGAGLPKWPEARSGLTMELGDHFAPRLIFTPEKLGAYRAYAADGGKFGLP